MLIEELIEKAFSDGYEYALMEQREFAFKRSFRNAYKVTQQAPFSRDANRAVNGLVTKTKQQIENVSSKLVGASDKRKEIFNKAVTNRADKLANLHNNAERDPRKFLDYKGMERILRS